MDTYVTAAVIRRLREEKHLTQSELAARIGVTDKAAAARARTAFPLLQPSRAHGTTDLMACRREPLPFSQIRCIMKIYTEFLRLRITPCEIAPQSKQKGTEL